MSATGLYTLGAFLFAALLLLAGAMLRQEFKVRRVPAEPVYVINDAVENAVASLPEEVLDRLGKSGVRRVIEWSAHYLQGLADRVASRRGVTVVAGGEGNAIEYIRTQLKQKGFEYSAADIAEVLATEAHYLQAVGALGEPADEAELA